MPAAPRSPAPRSLPSRANRPRHRADTRECRTAANGSGTGSVLATASGEALGGTASGAAERGRYHLGPPGPLDASPHRTERSKEGFFRHSTHDIRRKWRPREPEEAVGQAGLPDMEHAGLQRRAPETPRTVGLPAPKSRRSAAWRCCGCAAACQASLLDLWRSRSVPALCGRCPWQRRMNRKKPPIGFGFEGVGPGPTARHEAAPVGCKVPRPHPAPRPERPGLSPRRQSARARSAREHQEPPAASCAIPPPAPGDAPTRFRQRRKSHSPPKIAAMPARET